MLRIIFFLALLLKNIPTPLEWGSRDVYKRQELGELKSDNHDSHRRLWDKNDEQDKALNDHETRITTLERK